MPERNPSQMAKNKSAATRALAEAKARHKQAQQVNKPKEYGGPKGYEPTRYGDWERKGIASDF